MNFSYPFTIKPQSDRGYLVEFVDIEEAFTEGQTIEEAVFNAQEVLTAILEQRLEDGADIPLPSAGKYKYRTTPSASVQAALLVHKSRNGTSLADLARALGASWPVAQRLEKPKHSPTLRQLERAAAALGKRLILSFE